MIEITNFSKRGGPLTKRIWLAGDGRVVKDGSACRMGRGRATRVQFERIDDLVTHIEGLQPHQAIALGALRDDLPHCVEVTTKSGLDRCASPTVIARTAGNIQYRPGAPALALIDFDVTGMPDQVARRIESRGGVWPTLCLILPDLDQAARVVRPSTSAGLCRADTGEQFAGSGGVHIYLHIANGADIDRFLRTLHARCWLAGFGWMMVSRSGQLLERSIVDRMVGAPERLVFEAAPITEAPLAQDRTARAPVVADGTVLDTIASCPPLSLLEQSRLRQLRAHEAQRLARDAKAARQAYTRERAQHLAERTGMAPERAARIITSQCHGVLLPDVVLPFDDEELAGKTVADVLANPTEFDGATLADPLEGPDYGLCKACIMLRADGTPWIHSFAHGRTI